MLARVERFIRRERLLAPGRPVLVAVSGGVDSMVLLHVLQALGHPCEVVHVDHGLRGEESDADREFVREQCARLKVLCHVRNVDVHAKSGKEEGSLQMIARELRMTAIREVLATAGIEVAALAHHRDDMVETLLLNLLRGTGLRGWGAIPARSGPFIRPLLHVDRSEIERWAREQGIAFREDSSNRDSKYLRNRVRHELIPQLEAMRPGARKAMARSIGLLQEMLPLALERLDEEIGTSGSSEMGIDLSVIRRSEHPGLLLAHLLHGKGVHPDTVSDILEAIIEGRVGAMFQGTSQRIVVDRERLVLIHGVRDALPAWTIDEDLVIPANAPLRIGSIDGATSLPANGPHAANFRPDRLRFPLELRPWRAGDRMRPAGLDGSKLISDILTDAKVPHAERASAYVLAADQEIIWLIGHRVAEGIAARDVSPGMLRIEWLG